MGYTVYVTETPSASDYFVEDRRTDITYRLRDETDAAMLRTLLLRCVSIEVPKTEGFTEYAEDRPYPDRDEDDLEG